MVSTFVVSLSDPMEQYRREAGVLFRRVRRPAAIAETASDFRPVRRERRGARLTDFVARLRHNTGAERRSKAGLGWQPQQVADQGNK